MWQWRLTGYAVSRLRDELTRLVAQVHQQAGVAEISEAVSLLMDDESLAVSDTARAIAQVLLDWAYDPANPDLLADLLLIHRRSQGLDRDPWPPALAARVTAGLGLLRGGRNRLGATLAPLRVNSRSKL